MATQTTNYGLTKPSYNETADIGVINSNMDIIDAKMKAIENKAGSGGGGGNTDTYGHVKVGSVTIDASGDDTIELVAGSNVTLTPDTTSKSVTISATGGGGTSVTVDSELSTTSENPVQNKVITQALDEKSNLISDAWNASTTYTVGQYCIYNNSLWKCLIQHSGQTPKTGTYWTKVSVANEITSVNNSLVATDGQKLYFDSKDGKYGYNTDPNRGADTFVPFRNAEVVYRDYTNSNEDIVNDILFTNNTNAPVTVIIAMIVSNTSASYRYTQIAINGEFKYTYNSGDHLIKLALQSGDILSMNKQVNSRAEVFVITDIA